MLGEEETSMREAQSCALAAHAQFLALVGALFNKLDRDGNARIDVEDAWPRLAFFGFVRHP